MATFPTGTVTFLFTDIEGSTKLAQQFRDALPVLLARHHVILREAIESHNGYVFQIIGDAFCAAFHTVPDALSAALDAQRALAREAWSPAPIKVRMGIHTGVAYVREADSVSGGYSGYATMAHVQRVMSAAHGGQVLLSNASAELAWSELSSGATLRDLGEHRLKDLVRPEHLFQLVAPELQSEFPPLKTLDAFPHNLPVQLSSFIGREREMAEVKSLLETTRLLTLTGAGGVGKTRLALQVGADLIETFSGGVWFVDLAPLADPALLPQRVASALGINEESSRPGVEVLEDFLRGKNLLLILDNCEHLVEACAQLADHLLRACSGLKILASGREPLGIAGELAWRVPSMALPEIKAPLAPAALSQYDAVRLFIDRAILAAPAFAVTNANAPAVAEICRRLDGIPLAIELAAARIRMFTPEQIVARLDDRFRLLTGGSRTALPRQQTLRALIDWSYDLLPAPERTLLQRLSAFAGGWTFEAAEQVCPDLERTRETIPASPSIAGFDILDLLTHLVDKSLVVVEGTGDEARYRLLQMIRQYAAEKLAESGETSALRRRHLAYMLRLAQGAEPELEGGPLQIQWSNRLEEEDDNLRAALEFALENDPLAALRLASALGNFWLIRGHWLEGRARLENSIAKAAVASQAEYAKGNMWAAAQAIQLGDLEAAKDRADRAVDHARQSGDGRMLAQSLAIRGEIALEGGEAELAASLLQEAIDRGRETQNIWATSFALGLMGVSVASEGRYDRAAELLREALALSRQREDVMVSRIVLYYLGSLSMVCGDPAAARAYMEEALEPAKALGFGIVAAHMGEMIARSLAAQGNPAAAAPYLAESLTILRETGAQVCMAHLLEAFARLALAGTEGAQPGGGDPVRAVRLLAAADGHLKTLNTAMMPLERALYDQTLERTRRMLDGESFERAWADGEKITVEQALDDANKARSASQEARSN
ncbi:MAG: ATP-binding protein [Rudaea sp.]